MAVYETLAALGIALPEPTPPVAAFVPWVRSGDLIFVSGHIAKKDGRPWIGQLGATLATADGQDAARQVAIDLIGTLQGAVGDLSHVERIVKLTVLVNSTAAFIEHHLVANGASELFRQVFAGRGEHARSAFGVAQVPFGSCLEIELVAQVSKTTAGARLSFGEVCSSPGSMDSANAESSSGSAYEQLVAWLDKQGVRYRVLEHQPEGRTELVSAMRGHDTRHAAKCMVLMAKQGKKVTRFVLAVIPGDARIDLQAVKSLLTATYVSFASPDVAEKLARAPLGAVLPFAIDAEVELIADPSLLESEELYFNAARLDRSIALNSHDYVAVANARFAPIIARQ